MRKGFRWTHVLALVLALTLMAGAVALAADGSALSKDEIDKIVNTTTDASKVTSPFTQVANQVRGSVVGINNYQMTRNSYYDYYGWGFGYGGRNNEAEERKYATGSGVVVSNYGHVLTNYHVVEDATRITVTIADSEKEYDASLVSYSEDEDIAVLLVADLPVAPVELGDSDQLQVGEYAVVIGNPLSELFARTVTVGIVSALDRPITDTTYDAYGRRTKVTNSMIQVDAAINSGNSGGGMFNTLGQLMGIPARKYSNSGNSFFSSGASVENIGMCIPINVAKPYIREALEKYNGAQDVRSASSASSENRPMLGVTIFSVNSNGILPNGAIVREVSDNSNAQRGGIEVGDIIVEINGTKIASSNELSSYIRTCSENDELTVKVYRLPGLKDHFTDRGIDLEGLDTEGKDEYYHTLTVTLLNDKAA